MNDRFWPILLKNSMFGRARLRVLEDRVVG